MSRENARPDSGRPPNPLPASAIVTAALADAAEYRAAHADVPDSARAAEYRDTAAALAAGRVVVLSSAAASHVAPDGTLALALDDLAVALSALADASAWREWRADGGFCAACIGADPGRCAEHARDADLAAAYAALARALGHG
jgi:hypothetical protein